MGAKIQVYGLPLFTFMEKRTKTDSGIELIPK